MKCSLSRPLELMAVLSFVGLVFTLEVGTIGAQSPAPQFERDILPVFRARCLKCHGQSEPQAGLDLRTVDSTLKGGAGGPVLVKGSAEKSVLFQRIANHTMPPAGTGVTLTDSEIQTLRKWIDTASLEVSTAAAPLGAGGSQGSSRVPNF